MFTYCTVFGTIEEVLNSGTCLETLRKASIAQKHCGPTSGKNCSHDTIAEGCLKAQSRQNLCKESGGENASKTHGQVCHCSTPLSWY